MGRLREHSARSQRRASAHDSVFVWAGCEAETAQALKAHWHGQQRLAPQQMLVSNYWRRGDAESLDGEEH
jgi:NADPH-dependent ferric siderophore reductase